MTDKSKRPTPPGIAHGHLHAEAFCLMLYRSRDGQTEEWVWNSRDGVTPFSLQPRDLEEGEVLHMEDPRWLSHVEWWRDTYAPNYKPVAGDRYFVDWTREEAETHYRKVLEDHSKDLKGWGSTEDGLKLMMTNWEPGQPTIREVPR